MLHLITIRTVDQGFANANNGKVHRKFPGVNENFEYRYLDVYEHVVT